MAARSSDYRDRLLAIAFHLRDVAAIEPGGNSTRSEILSTAISLFTRKGYAGTSMREIAARVGIQAASLYGHAPEGKEQLLRLGLHSILNRFLDYITRDIRPEMSPRDQLHAIVTAHATWQLVYGDQALAWDAAINQFGVAGVLDDASLADVRRVQALYHDYLESLVAAECADASAAADVAAAIRILCDQAPSWLDRPGQADDPGVREEIVGRVWNLAVHLLGLPAFGPHPGDDGIRQRSPSANRG